MARNILFRYFSIFGPQKEQPLLRPSLKVKKYPLIKQTIAHIFVNGSWRISVKIIENRAHFDVFPNAPFV